MPFISSEYRSELSAIELTEAPLHPNAEAQFSKIGETQSESLRQLKTLFQALLNKPGAPPRV